MYVPVRAQVKYKWDGTGRRAGAAGRRDDDNRRLTDFLLDDSPHSNYFSACAAPATIELYGVRITRNTVRTYLLSQGAEQR